jgi:hypothetical protein
MNKLSLVVKLSCLALGIMSAVLMAQKAFGFTFNDDFVEALKGVESFVGAVVWPFELLLVRPAVKWLHEQGLVFELHSHWRQIFVLLWLYFGSYARAHMGKGLLTAFVWLRAGIIALVFGALAGTVPLSHPAVFWWPAAGYFLSEAVISVWEAWGVRHFRSFDFRVFARHGLIALALAVSCALAAAFMRTVPLASNPAVFWWPFLLFNLYSARRILFLHYPLQLGGPGVFAAIPVYGVFAVRLVPAFNLLFEASPSPGLASFAAVVAIEGGSILVTGMFQAKVWWRKSRFMGSNFWREMWLHDTPARISLDVLSVLGGATAIIYIAHELTRL